MRKLLQQMVVHGRRGFGSGKRLSAYKRVTSRNMEVAAFQCGVEGCPDVMVVLCASANNVFMTAWKETDM